MKRIMLALLVTTTMTAAAPAVATAQSVNERAATFERIQYAPNDQYRRDGGDRGDDRRGGGDGQNINQRQAELDARIDAGVRNGSLTNAEAQRLRAEFADIARAEAQYRANGRALTPNERADLDRRFDLLSSRIQYDRNDGQNRGGGGNINQRQIDIEARIEAGVRNRTLTRREAAELRAEFQAIARIENDYRSSGRGLTQVERQSLDRRIEMLERRLREDRRDDDRRWTQLDQRQAEFDQRLDQAVRERRVSPRDAAALKMEFRSIARLERQYRMSRPGITPPERLELNRRFDRMEANFRASISPTDNLFDLLLGLAGAR